MANEVNREKLPEVQTEVGESGQDTNRIAELEGLLAKKDGELTKLEQAVVAKDSDIANLKQSKGELEARLANVSNSLAEAVASYKTLVVQANPEVVEELISGDTIEAINESLKQAKTIVSKVRQGVEAEIQSAKVPAGAPERSSPDLSVLSPREKIKYAIGGKR